MIYPDFEEFVASLNAHRVRYLIVGAYAVAFHARPRATKDIDVLIDRAPANARRAHKAIVAFLGSEPPNITPTKLENPRTLVVLGVEPVRIDILTSILGVEFGSAWKRKVRGTFGDVPANYLGLADLIQAKAATPASRVQDKADLQQLRRVAKQKRPR